MQRKLLAKNVLLFYGSAAYSAAGQLKRDQMCCLRLEVLCASGSSF